MKELLKVPNDGEMRMLFEPVANRDLNEGNLRENDVWMNYITAVTGLEADKVRLMSQADVLRVLVLNADRPANIEDYIIGSIDNPSNVERVILKAGAAFHIRYTESEYRLSIDSSLGAQEFGNYTHRPVNYDVYGPSGASRVRFSPEFSQVRLNVKIPLQEYSDGRRTRQKFEYRGQSDNKDRFIGLSKIVAMQYLSVNPNAFLVKQGVEIIRRDQDRLPVWLNRQLLLDDQYGHTFTNPGVSPEVRLALLDDVLTRPEEYTHTHPVESYWIEVDATDEQELRDVLDSYKQRSDSSLKETIFASAQVMK